MHASTAYFLIIHAALTDCNDGSEIYQEISSEIVVFTNRWSLMVGGETMLRQVAAVLKKPRVLLMQLLPFISPTVQ